MGYIGHLVVLITLLLGNISLFYAKFSSQSAATYTYNNFDEEKILLERFSQWKRSFQKEYTNKTEESKRYELFKQMVRFVEAYNKEDNHTSTVELNEFADQTIDEIFTCVINVDVESLLKPSLTGFQYENFNISKVLEHGVDWRKEGKLTPVKNQRLGGRSCGSCWAFATVAAVEGSLAINQNRHYNLSEQQLIDCDDSSNGCQGGHDAFDYIFGNGITSSENYPYKAMKQETCDYYARTLTPRVFVDDYVRIAPRNIYEIIRVVRETPVYVGIHVGCTAFASYKSGILKEECATNNLKLNHAVAIVGFGYDQDEGLHYWIIKNSWGTGWGEGGYGRLVIRRSPLDPEIAYFGIGLLASYPIIDSD